MSVIGVICSDDCVVLMLLFYDIVLLFSLILRNDSVVFVMIEVVRFSVDMMRSGVRVFGIMCLISVVNLECLSVWEVMMKLDCLIFSILVCMICVVDV